MSYKPPLPQTLDGTVKQVADFTNQSERRVYRKLAAGVYQSYKNGDTRLITWESVLAERARLLAQGPQLSRPQTAKKRGRPRKHPDTQAAPPPDRTTAHDHERHGGNDGA